MNDNKLPQDFRSLPSILADLNYAAFWMVSTRPVISKSSSPWINPLVTVPITICIIVTFMCHSVFNSIARSRYLSLFSYSFNITLFPTGTPILKVLFFFLFFLILLDLFVWPRFGDPFVSQTPSRVFASHSLWQNQDGTYTIFSYDHTSNSCTIRCGSLCSPHPASSYLLSVLICCIHLLWD